MAKGHSDIRLPVAALLLTLIAAVLAIGLVALAERIGLQAATGAATAALLIALTLVVLAVIASTSRVEGMFQAGRQVGTLGGALVAGLMGAACARLVLVGDTPGRLAGLLAAIPLAFAAAAALRPALAASAEATPAGTVRERYGAAVQIPVVVALASVCAMLIVLSHRHAASGLAAVIGLSPGASSAVILSVAGACLVAGGSRSLVSSLLGVGVLCTIGLALPVAMAAGVLGPLPLPDLTEPDILSAIHSTRERWFGAARLPVQPVDWSELQTVFTLAQLPLLCGVALVLLCVLMLVPLGRGAPLSFGALKRDGLAGVLVVLSVLATIAVVAYGIDAAAISFIGAPAARPPAGLLEAGRLGLVHVCGAPVATAAALRTACGGLPLAAQLTAEQVQLLPAYALQGLPVALELPAALALLTRLVDVALAFVLLLVSAHLLMGVITQDVARGWLFRRTIVSWQVAMGRLTVVLLLVGVAALPALPAWVTWQFLLLPLAGLTLILLPLLLLWSLPGAGWWTGLACVGGAVTTAGLLAPPFTVTPVFESVLPVLAFGVLAGCLSGLVGRLLALSAGLLRSRGDLSPADTGLPEPREPTGTAPGAP
jgi:hypothetical protein